MEEKPTRNNKTKGTNECKPLLSADELQERMKGISITYHLIDVRRDRESFYALTDYIKDMISRYDGINVPKHWLLISGLCLNLIMDGQLEESQKIIDSIPEKGYLIFLKLGLTVVNPLVTYKELTCVFDYLKKINKSLSFFILTASRPSLLNGFNDFSRIGPFLPKHREKFLDFLKLLYDSPLCPYIYNLCLAEYYYQTNRLMDSEMLVSSSLKKFDIEGEKRIIFSSLYLQSKILLAHGKSVKSESFIQNMRKLSGQAGKAEFNYNIDAAEVLFALYDGKISFVNEWLASNAPDEFADFNMLDLYRYMIKMRCYIATGKYASVIALAERLRPLVTAGRRHMDLCELDLLEAMSLFASKNKEAAFEALSRALKIARMHRYYRLIADEGESILHLLIDYIKENGENPFLMMLAEMTRDMAIRHPLYMKTPNLKGDAFTPMEIDILSLLEQGKANEEIAEYFFISVNTVKWHIKNIYAKLGAKSATQAVWKARVAGILGGT